MICRTQLPPMRADSSFIPGLIGQQIQPIKGARAKAASNSPNLKPPNSLFPVPNAHVIHPISSRTMFLQRTASALARRSPARAFTLAQRPFSSSIIRRT